jgi:hypothetical protein
MSSIQKHVGPDHKISIHQNHNGQWELALIDAYQETNGFVPPQFWAWSEDGLKLLYLESQVDEHSDIIFCVRIDQLPKLWEAARRYALAKARAVIDVTPEQRDQPITVSRVRA